MRTGTKKKKGPEGQRELPLAAGRAGSAPRKIRKTPGRKPANHLDTNAWMKNSISIWRGIRKNAGELRLDHPAVFPAELAAKLIECFTTADDETVLDPFAGTGSTLAAAAAAGKTGLGFEISEKYAAAAEDRLRQTPLFGSAKPHRIIRGDARTAADVLAPESVDICITSPPYWNILDRERTADGRGAENYGGAAEDAGSAENYGEFVEGLGRIFEQVRTVLKPGKYCLVNVMDIRKKARFYPLHADLATELAGRGWIFDDLIIWDRQGDYNSLKPLGWPTVFRINRIHEYILIFQKRKAEAETRPKMETGAQPE